MSKQETRYETLSRKACVLTDAAHRMFRVGNKSMALIWAKKADELFAQASRLTIEEAERAEYSSYVAMDGMY